MTTIMADCKTPVAVLICAVKDVKGVLRFPVARLAGDTGLGAATPGSAGDITGAPGLAFAVKPLLPINVQLVEAASRFFGLDVARSLRIEQEFADEITSPAGEAATLYVATLDAATPAEASWPSMPDLLRRLVGRARVPYLRAWQVLAGGLQLNTKAVDAADVAKYFDD